MDRRTYIFVGICVVLLVLYQPLLRLAGLGNYLDRGRARPAATDTTRRAAPVPDATETGPAGGTTPGATASNGAGEPASMLGAPLSAGSPATLFADTTGSGGGSSLERTYDIETPLYQARFDRRGARLISVQLKNYASALGASSLEDRHVKLRRGEELEPGDRVTLAGGPLFALDLGSGSAMRSLATAAYAVSESADASGRVVALTFTARDRGGLEVRQSWRARPQTYALDFSVEIRGVPDSLRLPDYSLTLRSWPLVTEHSLQSDERSLKAISMLGQDVRKDNPQGLLKAAKTYDGNVVWTAVQNRYFMAAAAVIEGSSRGVIHAAEQRPLTAEQKRALPSGTKNVQDLAISSLRMALPGSEQPAQHFVMYFGPVEYFRLSALKLKLERAVDLGWTWVLPFSRALLQLMKWLYGLIPNYGVAIILLATLVRVVLHPLNMSSMKSQRALMKLQPEMERVRAKHKNDPTAMNAAIMALYKQNKVNPAGGCLPMVVQMPLFIALYSVLFNAIELRQAPFIAWIGDLSAPDLVFSTMSFPIRLLPLLMAGSGFLTQMLTPTDPSQRPTMYLMNVMMLVFFYNLPSGLVLYWTVMNLLTAAQQWLVMRQDGGPAPGGSRAEIVEVVSPAAARRGKKG